MNIPNAADRLKLCVTAMESIGIKNPVATPAARAILLEMVRQELITDILRTTDPSDPALIKALSEIVTALYRSQ